jgi:hypothetical protein
LAKDVRFLRVLAVAIADVYRLWRGGGMAAVRKPSGQRLATLLIGALCGAAGAGALAASGGADLPRATAALGGFAFPDRAGSRLMLLGEVARPFPGELPFTELLPAAGTIRTAYCAGGTSHPITFERRQLADGKGNGRQQSYQFDHLDGLVFGVNDGVTLTEHEGCFLAADAFARSLAVIPVVSLTRKSWPPETPACSASLTKDIASRRKREVANCWAIAESPAQAGLQVVLVEFARQGKDALASLVVVDGGTTVFADQQGDASRGDSVWRVSDGGVLQPDAFKIVFLAKRAGRLVLAVHWQAEEGSALMLLESNGETFRQLLQEYWYQMPTRP